MALPYHLYVISTSGTDMEAQLPIAYGTALVLIIIILVVNLLANALRKYFSKKVKTKKTEAEAEKIAGADTANTIADTDYRCYYFRERYA